jgi:hypothetical protein
MTTCPYPGLHNKTFSFLGKPPLKECYGCSLVGLLLDLRSMQREGGENEKANWTRDASAYELTYSISTSAKQLLRS